MDKPTAERRRDTEVITLVGFAHAVSHFFQLAFPPLYPWLMREFALSFTQVGLLMTTFFVVSAIGQAAAGVLVDRVGPRPVLLLGLGALALSGVLLALASSPAALFVAAAVAGLGNSVFHPVDYTLLNRLISPPRLTQAFSAHTLAGTIGWALAPVSMFALASAFSWRTAAIGAALLALLPLVMLLARRAAAALSLPPTEARHAAAESRSGSAFFAFLASCEVWLCFAFFFCWTMAFSALQNYAPAVFQALYALPLAVATSSVSAYLLGSAAGTLSAGFWTRAAAPDRAVAGALLLAALLAVLLASTALPGASVMPLMALMGFGVGYASPSRDLLVRKAAIAGAGPASYGRIYGFVYCGLDAGLALSPLLFGRFMDAALWEPLLWGVAFFQGLAILAAFRVGGRPALAVRAA